MPFRMYCDNKGCGRDTEPLLDVESNMVECTECGKEIKSATHFARNTLKSMGQIKRGAKNKSALSVQCYECKKEDRPKLDAVGNVVCGLCGADLNHLSNIYKNYLKEQLVAAKKRSV